MWDYYWFLLRIWNSKKLFSMKKEPLHHNELDMKKTPSKWATLKRYGLINCWWNIFHWNSRCFINLSIFIGLWCLILNYLVSSSDLLPNNLIYFQTSLIYHNKYFSWCSNASPVAHFIIKNFSCRAPSLENWGKLTNFFVAGNKKSFRLDSDKISSSTHAVQQILCLTDYFNEIYCVWRGCWWC